ncbi:hypothetical protein A8144_12845 [Mycobacterium leprae 3125609]|nr:hypothetical protein A8144_12845 [Mycobacterium leprae 3125609]OAX70287.1 hypothetical protein A3216_12875 [Mycobacterium leprae 7935681]
MSVSAANTNGRTGREDKVNAVGPDRVQCVYPLGRGGGFGQHGHLRWSMVRVTRLASWSRRACVVIVGWRTVIDSGQVTDVCVTVGFYNG